MRWVCDYEARTLEIAPQLSSSCARADYLDNWRVQTVWNLAHLIDLGLIIHKLEKLLVSEELISRLRNGEPAAYSEAKLAEHFLDQGLEITLQPVVTASGRRNDISVKIGSEWVNIEVKTPMESDLKKEVERDLGEILQLVDVARAG